MAILTQQPLTVLSNQPDGPTIPNAEFSPLAGGILWCGKVLQPMVHRPLPSERPPLEHPDHCIYKCCVLLPLLCSLGWCFRTSECDGARCIICGDTVQLSHRFGAVR